ncbi:MAG: nitroreductase family protein [Thermodesulfobacteriota bacterium]|nr:nitroreductase family protein [Thermodesulfobacteriota bacterium]
MTGPKFIPLTEYLEYSEAEMQRRTVEFYENIKRRRSIRQFSNRQVSREIIENCIRAAAYAPSGANMQPWYFVAAGKPEIKREIREAAEKEEINFYKKRAPEKWLNALKPLGTNIHKPFLETAPYLIVIFAQRYHVLTDGNIEKHYYVNESVGIATGILITAIHNAGLVSLTYTPSPMGFLNKILDRPSSEKAFLILVVGYPDENATVPEIKKKFLQEICEFV